VINNVYSHLTIGDTMGLSLNATGLLGSVTSSLRAAGETVFRSSSSAATSAINSVGGIEVCKGSFDTSEISQYKESSKQDANKSTSPANPGDAGTVVEYKRYPDNIGSEVYPHHVNFYININSKSKLAKAGQGSTAQGETTDLTTTDNATRKSQQGSKVGDIVNSDKGLGAIVPAKFTASYKRLKTAITLPLPSDISAEYSAEYGIISSGGIVGSIMHALASGKNLAEAGSQAMSDIIQTVPGHALKAAATAVGGAAGGVLGGAAGAGAGAAIGASAVDAKNFNALVNKASGVAINERLEQTFKQVNFRHFAFNYVFAPRTEKESKEINEIIKMFKYHMHPEVGDGGAFLIMPDEFDIEFRFGSGVNSYIHQVQTCALTNVSVSNSPTGSFASFRDGAPVMIVLQLRFVETTPLVREMIEKGY
jgi:hypothetical protein